jgi:choline dehydrogenase-like flavoprotein
MGELSEGRILTGADVTASGEERPDVCIVGSGAGGAVVAARLAERGARVVVLEEGGAFGPSDADMREATAYPRLYQQRGQRATSDLAITVLQGRALGGSTAVNWTACSRVPERVLALWRDRFGSTLTPQALAPHFEAVEERLSVKEQPEERVNANNRVLWDGVGKLGWQRERALRNVVGCADLGYCGMGCPIGARASADRTYVPDAVARGARIYTNARVMDLVLERQRAIAVLADVLDPRTDEPTGRRIAIRPKILVLSGGAINTPALLLRNGIDLAGKVGARTFLHPAAAMVGLHPAPIAGWSGAPQSVASREFAERGPGSAGFLLQALPVHPMLAGLTLGGFGAGHEAIMSRLSHASALVALAIDGLLPEEEGGRVAVRPDNRIALRYHLPPEIWEALREGCRALARVHLAAGAEVVFSSHEPPVEIRGEADLRKLDEAPWVPNRIGLFTIHPVGGCALGRDPESSVVTPELKLNAHENVYVVDGSVFPTSLGVNPQLTIFALARWAAEHVASAIP